MRTLADLYVRNATLYPDRDAFVCGDQRLTYRRLLEDARQLASALERAGLSRQGRVGIFAANCVEYFVSLAACEIGAFIAAGFNFRSAVPELEHLIAHSGATVIVFGEGLSAVVDAARPAAAGVTRYVCIGGAVPEWATSFRDFQAEGDPAGPGFRPAPDDYANLFYTSGTTGRPKGVAYTHDGLLVTAARAAQEEETSLLQITPAFHVGGRCPALGAMWHAGKTVLTHGFEPGEWLQIVERERINTTFMVPMMMQAVLAHPDRARHDLSSLQWVMAASTAIPPALLTQAVEEIGPVFFVAYGSTECGSVTRLRRQETRADGPPEMTARLASVGHAETAVELALLDDDGRPVAPGEVGEVCVKSAVFTGYWNDPQATAEAMHGAYVRTGDMGRFDDRCYLYLVDRKKDIIISGGENIYSREVEDVLHRHPAVQSASVIGAPDPVWGERVIAVVVTRAGEVLDEAAVIAFSQAQLARYKCPKQVIFADAMPLSGTGKIDKAVLRARVRQDRSSPPAR